MEIIGLYAKCCAYHAIEEPQCNNEPHFYRIYSVELFVNHTVDSRIEVQNYIMRRLIDKCIYCVDHYRTLISFHQYWSSNMSVLLNILCDAYNMREDRDDCFTLTHAYYFIVDRKPPMFMKYSCSDTMKFICANCSGTLISKIVKNSRNFVSQGDHIRTICMFPLYHNLLNYMRIASITAFRTMTGDTSICPAILLSDIKINPAQISNITLIQCKPLRTKSPYPKPSGGVKRPYHKRNKDIGATLIRDSAYMKRKIK